MNDQKKTNLLCLCYHYLQRTDDFYRVWGSSYQDFKDHVAFLQKTFPPISLEQLTAFIQSEDTLPGRCSYISFDDGLKEHASFFAPYLAEKGISATFFPPTCILENTMSSVQIVHIMTAKYGIKSFFRYVEEYFSITKLSWNDYFGHITFYNTSILEVYSQIKHVLYYVLPVEKTELLLQSLYVHVLKKDYSEIMNVIHCNEKDIQDISAMGHSIGVHTHSHISFTNTIITDDMWYKEIVKPKSILEDVIQKPITSFAFPFGGTKQAFDFSLWEKKLLESGFTVAFNTYKQYKGDKTFDPMWIERYAIQSQDIGDSWMSNAFVYQL